MTDNHDPRSSDKFVVRMKEGQRDRVKARAKADNQSMNDTVISALDRYLDQGERFDKLLELVDRATRPQGGAFVTIRREHLQALYREASHTLSISGPAMVAAANALHVPE